MDLFATLTVVYGLINTICIHLSKAMQDHGIRLFKRERERVIRLGQAYSFRGDVKEMFTENRKSYLWIYAVGVILNQTPMIWGTLGGRYGRAPYFTSVFPLGMVIVLLYSNKIIGDKIPKMEVYGISAIIAGTLILGIENIFKPPSTNELDYSLAWIIIAVFFLIAVMLIIYGIRLGSPNIIGVIFGSLGGVMGSLDPIMKDMGQEYGVGGQSSFFPGNFAGWVIFLISFLMGAFSFFITQWGYAYDAKAPLMTGFYNVFYLSFPVALYALIDSTFTISVFTIVGFVINVIGIVILSNHVKTMYRANKLQLMNVPIEYPEMQ